VVPLYWLGTLGVFTLALLWPQLLNRSTASVEQLVMSLFFIPFEKGGVVQPMLFLGWTLNYEMFFYLLFAAGLLAPAKLRPWLVSGALAALVAVRPLADTANPLLATYTDPILLEFAAGVWLGKLWSEGRLPSARIGWLLVALGLAGFAAVTIAGTDVSSARVLLWGIPALLLVAGAVTIERRGSVPNLWPLRALGDASYSVYLIHGLAISAAVRALALVGLQSPVVLFVTAIVVGVVAGLIAYQLIEKPAMKLFRTGLGAHRPRSPAIAPAP
jgi:exopolysaccharide production protein ExoZ